jgi:copper chaperone CopZ
MRILILAALLAVAVSASAPAAAAPNPELVTVKVNGLVCDFCARSIEAMMKKRADVAGVHVDLDKGEVHLRMKANSSLDDPELKKLMIDSGYSVTGIERKAL